jgi:type I restriction enzyme S subunit
MTHEWPLVRLDEVLKPVSREEPVDATKEYRLLGVRLDGQGPFLRETVTGSQTAAKKLFRVVKGDFIYSRLFACRGAFGVIGEELDGGYVSGEFPTFVPVPKRVDLEFLRYWFRLPSIIARVDKDCSGSTPLTRNRFNTDFHSDK